MVERIMREKQKSKIEKSLEKEVKEMEGNWKRAVADYRNLEKRVLDERQEHYKYSLGFFIQRILPAIDNLERAKRHIKDNGLDMAITSLLNVLQDEGLEEIDVLNKEFDPQFCECIDFKDGEEGKVVRVVEKGYRLGGRVIRPAKVIIGRQG